MRNFCSRFKPLPVNLLAAVLTFVAAYGLQRLLQLFHFINPAPGNPLVNSLVISVTAFIVLQSIYRITPEEAHILNARQREKQYEAEQTQNTHNDWLDGDEDSTREGS